MNLDVHRIAQGMCFRLDAGSQDRRSYGDDDAVSTSPPTVRKPSRWGRRTTTAQSFSTSCSPISTGLKCPRLRAAGQWHPVLVLAAREAIHDRVAGLDGGRTITSQALLVRGAACATPGHLSGGWASDCPRGRRSHPRSGHPSGEAPAMLSSRTRNRPARVLHRPSRGGLKPARHSSSMCGISTMTADQTWWTLRPRPTFEGRPAVPKEINRDGARRRLSLYSPQAHHRPPHGLVAE